MFGTRMKTETRTCPKCNHNWPVIIGGKVIALADDEPMVGWEQAYKNTLQHHGLLLDELNKISRMSTEDFLVWQKAWIEEENKDWYEDE